MKSTDLVPQQHLEINGLQDVRNVSELLYESKMFPDLKSAAQAGVKILAGMEYGFGPFASQSGIHIIQGKASLGSGLLATALKRHPAYDYRVTEWTDKACTIEVLQRVDGEWVSLGPSRFTEEDAKRAGLIGNANWKKYPRNMLFARAMSNAVSVYAPDAIDGRVYVPDELGSPAAPSDLEIEVEDITPTADEIEDAEVADAPYKPTEDDDELDSKYAGSLHRKLGAIGIPKEDHYAFASMSLDREIDTFVGITVAESRTLVADAEEHVEVLKAAAAEAEAKNA